MEVGGSTEIWRPKPWRSRVECLVMGAEYPRSSLNFSVFNVEHREGAVECTLLLRVIHVVMLGRVSAGDNMLVTFLISKYIY